jgi:hypothetical protein
MLLFGMLPFRRYVLLMTFCMYTDYQVSVPSGRNELIKISGSTRVIRKSLRVLCGRL